MYDPAIIFQRTQAGRDEIQKKSHGLTQSERLVLIMVDGVSPYQEVRSKLPVLTDERFERAMQKLQTKELVLEVFLPVEGQAPEEIERTVIDLFLQQDPLDPVTIMLQDPEEEFGEIAAALRSFDPPPSLVMNEFQAVGQAAAPEPTQAATRREAAVDDIHAELADQFSRELKERRRNQSFERAEPRPESRPRKQPVAEKKAQKPSAPHWGYWLIAIGFAFIAGYLMARFVA